MEEERVIVQRYQNAGIWAIAKLPAKNSYPVNCDNSTLITIALQPKACSSLVQESKQPLYTWAVLLLRENTRVSAEGSMMWLCIPA